MHKYIIALKASTLRAGGGTSPSAPSPYYSSCLNCPLLEINERTPMSAWWLPAQSELFQQSIMVLGAFVNNIRLLNTMRKKWETYTLDYYFLSIHKYEYM